jgi:uncharacterized protein (TIGR00251 family)
LLTLKATVDGCTLSVRLHPGAKRDAVNGVQDGALKISLTTPPTDGRANAALITFIADRLGVARAQVTLLMGVTSRSKAYRWADQRPGRGTAAE